MSEESSATATVLIVDDEKRAADTYAAALDDEYDVRIAYGGEEGLARIDEEVDVVLLDRRMSDISGNEVLQEIKDRHLDCRVAMVTAVNPDFDILSLGVDDYVVKPVGKERLLTTVERLLALKEHDDAYQELSTLKVKRNVLAVEKPEAELTDNEEFSRLESRIEELETQLEDIESEFELPGERTR
ncbi:response regulator transcription factor [Halorientalis brevis]|uniref:Response regulator transcription factor n=1 Tax=Halorientalis brevis TaxID=1126241 RepID=A0ABD6CAF6_9EURY|nr:response regulator [Halorientalis brevis]